MTINLPTVACQIGAAAHFSLALRAKVQGLGEPAKVKSGIVT